MNSLLSKIKRKIKSYLRPVPSSSTLNVLESFPLFLPESAGSYSDRAFLTLQSVNATLPLLNDLVKSTCSEQFERKDIQAFMTTPESKAKIEELAQLLNHYGSDKANHHNYHYLYSWILTQHDITNIFEVGLGTNYEDVVSHMGNAGKPGASIRSFRDFCPNANVYGADIDRRILFTEDRIQTFYVDQTKAETFLDLEKNIPTGQFDLIIDDGLHSPDANLMTLNFALRNIKVGGWAVLEDVPFKTKPLWETVCVLLQDRYNCMLITTANCYMVAFQRKA